VAITARRTALDETKLHPSCKRTWLKTAVWTVPNESELSMIFRGNYRMGDNRQWLLLSGGRRLTILHPSCKRMCLKTAIRRIPARNQAFERIDETELFSWQVDDA
jgi:hypothetical protein